MTQSQLAKILGISPASWSRVERGEFALRPERIADAAALLGIEPLDLIRRFDAAKAARVGGSACS